MHRDIVTRFIRCYYYHMMRNELFLRSAALTYYAIFSLSPLLILISTGLGVVLRDPTKQQAVMNAVINLMPEGTEAITNLLQEVISTSAVTSAVALLTLLWSATGFLRGLLATIDLVHSRAYTHSSFLMRGVGVLIILLAVPALFLLLVLSGLSAQILQAVPWPLSACFAQLLRILASGFPVFILAYLTFFLMMRYIPGRRTPTRTILISTGITAAAWTLLGYGFSWYLHSGFSNFNVIYGSIGAVMALMLYLYLSSLVILLGAQLNATLSWFKDCRAPHMAGLDDLLKLLRLPIPALDDAQEPPSKPTIAP